MKNVLLKIMMFSFSLLPVSAYAADQFTFTIPYSLQNLMPEVSRLSVNCLLFINKPARSLSGLWHRP